MEVVKLFLRLREQMYRPDAYRVRGQTSCVMNWMAFSWFLSRKAPYCFDLRIFNGNRFSTFMDSGCADPLTLVHGD